MKKNFPATQQECPFPGGIDEASERSLRMKEVSFRLQHLMDCFNIMR